MEARGPASEMERRLRDIVAPVVRSEGLMLVELNWRRESGGQVLRLIVDRREGGVSLDDCALLSRQVSDLLDVEDPTNGAFNLEVSSPGLTRKLKDPAEFDLFAGRLAKLTVSEPDGKSRTLRGVLKGTMGEDVLIEVKGKPMAVPVASVAKARLEIDL